jgi:hypothetical protein
MNHFWQNIHGWTDEHMFFLYSEAVRISEEGSHFVEIGSWKGRSSSFMCVEIIKSGKKIKFHCVDPWTGSEEHQKGKSFEDKAVVEGTLFEEFTQNMKSVESYYNAVKLPSVEAAKLYEDESLDFVFIDGAHDYDNVCMDIKSWLPKLKPGKLMTGHDWQFTQVQRAVMDTLKRGVVPVGTCWVYVKM